MKIAIITLEYPPQLLGGAGVYIERIAYHLASFGHQIHVVTLSDSPYYSQSSGNPHIHHLPVISSPRLRILSFWVVLPFYLWKITKEYGPFDLIHGNGISDLTLNKVMFPGPRVVTVHHLSSRVVEILKPTLWERLQHLGDETGLLPYLEAISYKRADYLVAVSDSTYNDLISKIGITPERIIVIRHGASPDAYIFPAQELVALRDSLNIASRPFLLFVGRLEIRKGIEILLQALTEVIKKQDIILVLAGKGDMQKYTDLAHRLGISKNVRFLGYVDSLSLRKLYAACDLFIFPSLWEGFGIVALEARSAGKFIVASAVGGIPEAVPSGAGYLVPPGDPILLAQAILMAVSEPHVGVSLPPTWKDVCQDLSDFYHTVLKNG